MSEVGGGLREKDHSLHVYKKPVAADSDVKLLSEVGGGPGEGKLPFVNKPLARCLEEGRRWRGRGGVCSMAVGGVGVEHRGEQENSPLSKNLLLSAGLVWGRGGKLPVVAKKPP
ncbi:hypothetical protein TWF506_006708 [Arthrobotrys conoides]|uniref:Uncharacterized protein n=1 Tax=Arthrobotrys conoides TaxID=74498 RepID=A0AAN8NU75_9PEZI